MFPVQRSPPASLSDAGILELGGADAGESPVSGSGGGAAAPDHSMAHTSSSQN